MVKFLICKKHPDMHMAHFSGKINVIDAISYEKSLSRFILKNSHQSIKRIVYYDTLSVLSDQKFIRYMAHFIDSLECKQSKAYIIGITGINMFFYKLFLNFKRKSYDFIHYSTIEKFELNENLNYSKDFYDTDIDLLRNYSNAL